MDCKYVEQHIVEYIDGQLTPEDAEKVTQHITTCDTCKTMYEETKSLLLAFNEVEEQVPSEHLREGFYKLLEEEKQLASTKVIPLTTQERHFTWKRAFQVAAAVLFLFTGYFFGSYNTKQHVNEEISSLQKQTLNLKEEIMLAMIENQSPSKRIQAVGFTESFVKPDAKILEALIERMKYDGNINVRLAAVEALAEFPESSIVKEAFIEALSVQKNPSLQISIIQFLVKTQEKRAIAPMQKLLKQEDTPDFVKEQVNNGLSEII